MACRRPEALAFAGLVLAGAAACGTKSPDLAGVRVALERDPSGLFAADFRPYEVEVLEDGSFTFTCSGLDAIERVRTGRISTAELAEVLEDAQDLGFFELEGAYTMGHSDGVAEILEIRHAGREKRITNYWIGGSREWLREFDPSIDLSHYEVHRGLSDLALRIDEAVGRRALLAELIALEQR